MATKRAALILAEGFEEIEAISVVDVLRRAGVRVSMVGIERRDWVDGAHCIRLAAEGEVSDLSAEDLDLLVLPGGMPGARNLAGSGKVKQLLRETAARGAVIGAICAAPIALAAAGLLEGRRVTCYPGFEKELSGGVYTGARVEVDGNIVTGCGPGGALVFALALLESIGLQREAGHLAEGMLIKA